MACREIPGRSRKINEIKIEDIAIQLFNMVCVFGNDDMLDRNIQCRLFLEPFLTGYAKENAISDEWLKRLSLFLRLKEIIVYTGVYRSFGMTGLNDWTKQYLSESKDRIKNGISIVETAL
jgi:Ser/Thr protein kinase RdoA (MazF antagonist)